MWLQTCRSNIISPILCPEDGINVLLRNIGNYQPAHFRPRSNQNESVMLEQFRVKVFEKRTDGQLIEEWTRVLRDSEFHCRVYNRPLPVPIGSHIRFSPYYTTL